MANETKLIGHEVIAADTMAFRFEKPSGFRFEAGQAINLVLPDSPGTETSGLRHTFSVVSAPFEDDIVIATRMRDSPFKRALKLLAIGSVVSVEGPFGSLTLRQDRTRPSVFIAGGIGITPFMSILRQVTYDGSAQGLVLLYSNRRPEDAAFLPELLQLEQRNATFRLVATMTQPNKSNQPWHGRAGVINEDLVQQVCGKLDAPVYYLAGPPGMVEAMRGILHHVHAPDGDVYVEEFYGY